MSNEIRPKTFRLTSRQINRDYYVVPGVSFDYASGKTCFLKRDGTYVGGFKDGVCQGRPIMPAEKGLIWDYNSRETKKFGDKTSGFTQNSRLDVEISYLEIDSHLPTDKLAENRRNKGLIEHLKNHFQVAVWELSNGERKQVNSNCKNIMFELEDLSSIEDLARDRNMNQIKAKQIITDIFENNPDEFIDICYGFGYFIAGSDRVKHLNGVCAMIDQQPTAANGYVDHAQRFIRFYESEKREYDILFAQGLRIRVDGEIILKYNENAYYLSEKFIGKTEDEAKHYLMNNANAYKLLKDKMNYAKGRDKVVAAQKPAETSSVKPVAPKAFIPPPQKKSIEAKILAAIDAKQDLTAVTDEILARETDPAKIEAIKDLIYGVAKTKAEETSNA